MKELEAPFQLGVVQYLNEAQTHTGRGHPGQPFTCANRNDGRHDTEGGGLGVLIAAQAGWVCPHCDYRQGWAHGAMAARVRAPDEASALSSFFVANIARTLASRIEAYRALAGGGREGATSMLACLLRRQEEFVREGR